LISALGSAILPDFVGIPLIGASRRRTASIVCRSGQNTQPNNPSFVAGTKEVWHTNCAGKAEPTTVKSFVCPWAPNITR
jgi:hypothetical protein